MSDRDGLILNHIGRYTLSIRAVIERLFFDGKSCDHVINRLQEEDRIQAISLPGNLSAYQLTLKEGRARGLEYRGRARVTPTTLRWQLSTLWFCCMTGYRRKRLLEREAKAVLEIPEIQRLNTPHVLHRDEDESTIYRLHVPEGGASLDDFIARLERLCFKVGQNDPVLAPWAERGTYQFAILSETVLRQEMLKEELEPKQADLPVKLYFETVPPYDGLADALRALRDAGELRAS